MDAADEASSTEAHLTLGQQQPARVTNDIDEELAPLRQAQPRQLSTADSVQSQVAEQQLSASSSSTGKVAESAQGQPETGSAEEEAPEPDDASAAGQEADSAEDDYADEFEPDEPVVESTDTELLPEKLYDNPLGGDDSAEEAEERPAQDSNSAHLDQSHAPHVAVTRAGAASPKCPPHRTRRNPFSVPLLMI